MIRMFFMFKTCPKHAIHESCVAPDLKVCKLHKTEIEIVLCDNVIIVSQLSKVNSNYTNTVKVMGMGVISASFTTPPNTLSISMSYKNIQKHTMPEITSQNQPR